MAKKRAFVKYTKQGRLIPGSLIVTTRGGYPVDGLYTEVPTNICCDESIPGTITASPKGWVRYTKKGAIVPGSLVVGKSHPKDGVWKEVYIDLCCATPTISCLTYTVESATIRVITIDAISCDGTPINISYRSLPGGIWGPACLQKDSLVVTAVDPYTITTGAACTSLCFCYNWEFTDSSRSNYSVEWQDCDGNFASQIYAFPQIGVGGSACAREGTVSITGNHVLSGGTVVCTNNIDCSTIPTTTTTTTVPQYTVGQSALGGIIGYILQPGDPGYDANVQHGLVVTSTDVSNFCQWGCDGTFISGTNNTSIGTGNQNTINIVAGCNTPGIAADLCANLVQGGYNDWYLPSKDELNKLYLNISLIGGTYPANAWYFSSSQFSGFTAWVQNLNSGQQTSSFNKNNNLSIKAIRSF